MLVQFGNRWMSLISLTKNTARCGSDASQVINRKVPPEKDRIEIPPGEKYRLKSISACLMIIDLSNALRYYFYEISLAR